MELRPGIYCPDMSTMSALRSLSTTSEGRRLVTQLDSTFDYALGQPVQFGPPVVPTPSAARWITTVTADLVRCLQYLVEVCRSDRSLQRHLSLPPFVLKDITSDTNKASGTVDLARIDLMLPAEEPVQAIESNANCPGGLHFAGVAAHQWRILATEAGIRLPAPLPHERPGWLADWYLSLCCMATRERPECVALLYDHATNSLEMPEFAAALRERGIRVVTGDPRSLTRDGARGVKLDGIRIKHGYLKLSMRRFAEWRPMLDPLVDAIVSGQLFVQNGLRARWIADNKLCLAVISDPQMHDLLPTKLREAVMPIVPWSRAVAGLPDSELDSIATNKDRFVLKTPYGTRGQGVTVGSAVDASTWATALKDAVRENWLVQRNILTATLDEGTVRHDLSIGVARDVIGALARSGTSSRLNVAQGSRLHPVYLHRSPDSYVTEQ